MTTCRRFPTADLYLGDCLDVLAELPEASVDTVITDPPYGLEFMGAAWDAPWSGDDAIGRTWQRGMGEVAMADGHTRLDRPTFEVRSNVRCRRCRKWRVSGSPCVCPAPDFPNIKRTNMHAFEAWTREWAWEVYRVAKPGATLMAFGGTRTWHRLACALEEAGWEIRDTVMWLYGCLAADTEILTEHGWKRGLDVTEGERVAAWDAATGSITLAPVEQKTVAPYVGDLIRFRNHDTDQLVTPNHRVYAQQWSRVQRRGEREGTWTEWRASEAGEINRWQGLRLPMAGEHDGAGIGGEDYAALLGWVWTEGGFDRSGSGVRVYQSPSANPEKVTAIASLFDRIVPGHRRYDRERAYAPRGSAAPVMVSEACWFFSGEMARRVRTDLPDKRPSWSLLWRMTLAEKRAFWSAAMAGDGSGHDFYQKAAADLEWAQALLACIGQRGKIAMRRAPREGGAVCVTPRATTALQHRHLQDATEPYAGLVWCVRVATGAFVARRNGQVFITGNSGFPKSLDISKAIDRAKGADRARDGYVPNHQNDVYGRGLGGGVTVTRAEAVTELARTWDGWGTALKPAWEPVIVAMKPCDGTFATNAERHGVAGLHIDGGRIATADGYAENRVTQGISLETTSYAPRKARRVFEPGDGRWPANVVLDEEAAAQLDAQSGEGGGGEYRMTTESVPRGDETQWRLKPTAGTVRQFGDAGGASRFFYTSKASRSEREHGLDDVPTRVRRMSGGVNDHGEEYDKAQSIGLNRAVRVRNHHPTVKPLDLIEYLVKLTATPTGGVVLDPFMGSGTVGVACDRQGRRFIGIEREPEYFAIACGRFAGDAPLFNRGVEVGVGP